MRALQALHGDMSQAGREAVLQRFRDGKVMVLVATDVAARGLDIANVDLVVHYELPKDQESFLHRRVPARQLGCQRLQHPQTPGVGPGNGIPAPHQAF